MKQIAVLTSGGDAPGMNAAVRSVVRCGLAAGLKVFGIRQGYDGLLEGRFEQMDGYSVSGLMDRGGSVIECARCPEMLEAHGPQAAARILRRREIDGLVVIGGDGSFRGALEIANCEIPVIGLPGTIDNDIPGTNRTIGFDTACDTLSWCIKQLRDTAASHHRTFIVEAMGRHSGWLALTGGIAGGADIILIPEVHWTADEVLTRLNQRIETGHSFNLIIYAEGAGASTDFLEGRCRTSDLAGWINNNTPEEFEVRVCIPGHIQRGGSPTTIDRLFATRCGQRAVQALQAGHYGVMIGECGGTLCEVPLTEAVSGHRTIDSELYELALLVA